MAEHKFTDEEIIKALECCANADCVNCPRWSEEWYSGMCADFLPSVLALFKRQKAKTEWISVEERLPEDEAPVLVFTEKGSFYVGYYYKAVTSPCFTGFYADSCKRNVTYWMPLPEPPKGE